MKEKKILVACMATMLSSSAGFAMMEETPQKQKVSVGSRELFVSPAAYNKITSIQSEILSPATASLQIDSDLNTQNVPQKYRERTKSDAMHKWSVANSEKELKVSSIAEKSVADSNVRRRMRELAAQEAQDQHKHEEELRELEQMVAAKLKDATDLEVKLKELEENESYADRLLDVRDKECAQLRELHLQAQQDLAKLESRLNDLSVSHDILGREHSWAQSTNSALFTQMRKLNLGVGSVAAPISGSNSSLTATGDFSAASLLEDEIDIDNY